MTVYYVMLLALLMLANVRLRPDRDRLLWGLAWILLVLFVGLRDHVGMDWNNYLHMTRWIEIYDWQRSLERAEPGYVLLTEISLQLGFGVYGVNLVVAMIFVSGLFSLCRVTGNKWLALAVAYPILIVVVANSATRQAAAIGILLWLVGSWRSLGTTVRILAVLAAASFHYSALAYMGFVAFDSNRSVAVKLLLIAAVLLVTGYLVFRLEARTRYLETYVLAQRARVISPGAALHVILNAVPAAILLLYRRHWSYLVPSRIVYYLAILTLILLPLSLFYSTAAGRLSYYLFPVSVCVFAALPGAFTPGRGRAVVSLLVSVGLVLQLWVWLNFANNRRGYIPYDNLLFAQSGAAHVH